MQIFCSQVLLLSILLWTLNISKYYYGTGGTDTREEDEDPYLTLVSKWCCALMIHINTQPKIEEAIQRFKYIKNHPQ